jgi:PAS domain S-box-containing protein
MGSADQPDRRIAVLHVGGGTRRPSQALPELRVKRVRDAEAALAWFAQDAGAAAALDVILIDAAAGEPFAIASRLRRAAPAAQVVVMAGGEQAQAIARLLPFAPQLRDAWVIGTESPARDLRALLRKAVSTAKQRQKLARLAEQINALASPAPAGEAGQGPKSPRRRDRRLTDRYVESVLAHVPDAMLATDLDGRVIAWNEAARALFARQTMAADGSLLAMFVDGAGRIGPLLEQARGGAVAKNVQTQIRSGEGATVDVEVTLAPVHDERGAVACVSFILRDITQRKAAERQLYEAMELAQAADRAKADFLARMSHELRTPLNAIIGFSEVMRAELFGSLGASRYKDYVEHVHTSGTYLLSLINQILDFSALEARKLTLALGQVDVAALVRECCGLMEGLAARSGITLVREIPDGLPGVEADRNRLRQIVLNLLSNAVKFTESGGRVTVTAGADATALTLAVADTGIGMSEDEVRVAAQPFARSETPMVRSREGTGLGLSIVQDLVLLHGGTIAIDSVPRRGTTVTVRLPLVAPERPGWSGAPV